MDCLAKIDAVSYPLSPHCQFWGKCTHGYLRCVAGVLAALLIRYSGDTILTGMLLSFSFTFRHVVVCYKPTDVTEANQVIIWQFNRLDNFEAI